MNVARHTLYILLVLAAYAIGTETACALTTGGLNAACGLSATGTDVAYALPATDGEAFTHLTADVLKVDSVLPSWGYDMPLDADTYRDSIYTAELLYPEFSDMPAEDIEMYERYFGTPLPELPLVEQDLIITRKQPSLLFSIVPIVFRDGRYQYLTSFKFNITAKAKATALAKSKAQAAVASRADATAAANSRYASHSRLATGTWGKIRVSSSGYYQLTDAVIRQAGFTDLSRVHIYGYGGNLVPERLTEDYLTEYDDLMPVTQYRRSDGKVIFYANGSVSWSSNAGVTRTRNPYSDYGYYFITQEDDAVSYCSADSIVSIGAATATDRYYSLYEKDEYAWYHGGRNLVERNSVTEGASRSYTIASPSGKDASTVTSTLTVCVSTGTESSYQILFNDSVVGKSSMSISTYDKANFSTTTYRLRNVKASNEVKIQCTSGGPLRLDYIQLYSPQPADIPDVDTESFPVAEYVYNITNQDHHADDNVDMVIIIPTSQSTREQAERLKAHHESVDGLTVRIVPADELYNEFSSGTPDVSAYRRYMKMLYDRAATEDQQPKYVLLFGDCVWDNRLLTSDCKQLSADDLLLCYESENSYNVINCYVSDDFIAMLDDNEAIATGSSYTGTPDIGIGRFPVITTAEAKNMVDKVITYVANANVGAWQNTIMFMGDDGNANLHMDDINTLADNIIADFPGYYVRKIMWDAYKRQESSTGNRYPDCEEAIKAQQKAGALIMDYAGHGAANAISHEYVLTLSDFADFDNTNLPIWITASCDIGPFDGVESTIGETVVTNTKGGGIAFFGTTRTVYANYNKYINTQFVRNILTIKDNGRPMTLGEATQKAKTYLVKNSLDRTVNKLQYSLLGDPAMALNVPRHKCVVDSINGIALSSGTMPTVRANSKVTVSGHVAIDDAEATTFDGNVSILVRDNLELLRGLYNAQDGDTLKYYDRTKNIFSGTDRVSNGRFSISFTVPRDINYSNETGLITLFAYNADGTTTAHGENGDFTVGGSDVVFNDSIGPSVYCYLNSPSFVNGGDVNPTPYFVAEVTDKNGINASGSGIGHNMTLVIDNDNTMTYDLNDNFQYDFGSYTSGTTYYNLPELSYGMHTLRFRAWDILNNPTTAELSFNVVAGLQPDLIDVNVTPNPASSSATFTISHDRYGSTLDVDIDIFDVSGRLMHRISDTVAANAGTSTVTWDLTCSNGGRLQTGVYLYCVRLSSDGSNKTSKAKKLLVM